MVCKYFYQDFLMNIAVDKSTDMPICKIEFVNTDSDYFDLWCENTTFDIEFKKRFIYLSYLIEEKSIDKWNEMFLLASNCDNILIIDDVYLTNHELEMYKEFYLKVYISNFSKQCKVLVFRNF